MSRGRELFAQAAPRAARLIEGGFAPERKPEARLRAAFTAALEESGRVIATAPGQADGSELFRREAAFSTEWLLGERYPNRWADLLAHSSRSRPLKLPVTLAVARVADVQLETQYGPSRLRVASVCAGTDATLDVD